MSEGNCGYFDGIKSISNIDLLELVILKIIIKNDLLPIIERKGLTSRSVSA